MTEWIRIPDCVLLFTSDWYLDFFYYTTSEVRDEESFSKKRIPLIRWYNYESYEEIYSRNAYRLNIITNRISFWRKTSQLFYKIN